MVFYQFQQAGNEEYQSKNKWNSIARIVAAGSNGTVANSDEQCYVANFSPAAKIPALQTASFLVFLLSTLVVITYVWFVWYFTWFVRLYKPL